MLRSSVLLATLASLASVYTADINCDIGNKCPTSAPCCSQYGVCGVGAYCLGGCDPMSSNALDSCVPEPVCKSGTTVFTSMDSITASTAYLGDSSKTSWVMQGHAVTYQNSSLLLTMAPNSGGTVLTSSTYMWYGNVNARLKTSRGRGVVTAFILLSDVKDEIDYEFVGVDLGTAQTNYYFQAIPDYANSFNITDLSDTFSNYHDYTIQWTPDTITWLVDGKVGRTKHRSDTWNATAKQWDFPQTPARVQLSIWPGGLATNAQGTIDWAGGEIDWTAANPDIATSGYYYAQFESVTMDCYNASTAPGTNLHTSYTFNGYSGLNNTVTDGTGPTILKSFLGTGTNMSIELPPSATSDVAVVPGLTGAGPGVAPHASASGTDGVAAAPASTNTGFSQYGGNAPSTKSAGNTLGTEGGRKMLGSSVLAGIVAMGFMLAL